MTYQIDKHIFIEFSEDPTDKTLDDINEAIRGEVGDFDTYTEEYRRPNLAEFRLAGTACAGFSEVKLLNDIHETSETITAVSSIDLQSPYGAHQFERSDNTPNEKHCELVRMFMEGIQANIQGVLDSVFPKAAE